MSVPIATTRPVEVQRGAALRPDLLVIEEPLDLRLEELPLAVTLRTPGHDRELAAGFLVSQGILERPDDLVALEPLAGDPHGNTIVARVAGGVEAHAEAVKAAARDFFSTSACGMCGAAALPKIEAQGSRIAPWCPDTALLATLPAFLDGGLFADTHGAHAAALVGPDGALLVRRDDIGRHNAVDKVVGWAFFAGRLPVHPAVLVISGRAGFEVVHKARVAGIPAVVSVGAASSLAVDLCRAAGIALFGFLRPTSFTRYC